MVPLLRYPVVADPPQGRLSAEYSETERMFLRAPEQGKIDPSGEGHKAQVWRLAAFNNRLNYPS